VDTPLTRLYPPYIFNENFRVVDQLPNTTNGTSQTMFQNLKTGNSQSMPFPTFLSVIPSANYIVRLLSKSTFLWAILAQLLVIRLTDKSGEATLSIGITR
jgi:hypothetical protein